MTAYKDISSKSGKFVLTLPNGTQKYFNNAEGAQQFFDENYKDKYSMVVKSIKDENEGDIVDGGELTGIEVIASKPFPIFNSPQFQDVWGFRNPIWGSNRVNINRRASQRNPNFYQNYDMLGNIIEGVNVMSGGFLNRLSPTQNIGLIIDTMQGDNVMKSWFGNSGIVSDKFQQNHPYWSMVINGIGDAGTTVLSKNLNNVLKLNRMEKWYTGVPHNQLRSNPGSYMDEAFPNYAGTRWLSNELDYARSFANDYITWPRHERGKIYTIFVDPKELNTLNVKTQGASHWSALPIKIENNKIIPDELFTKYADYPGGIKLRSISEKWYPLASNEGFRMITGRYPIRTDDVVKFSRNQGYNSTRFYNIMDGQLHTPEDIGYNKLIDELILHEGAPAYLADSKLDVAKQLNWSTNPNLGVLLYNSYNKQEDKSSKDIE